ncbi:hypothetical protein Q8A73_014491 [Channa argus]|nr:hypothetical protein Q8A73_014491 [Channa argus]
MPREPVCITLFWCRSIELLDKCSSHPLPERPGLIPFKATGICSQQSSDITWRNNGATTPSPPYTVSHDTVNEDGSKPGPCLPRAQTPPETIPSFVFRTCLMEMPLMRRGVGRNCQNTPRQLAALKAQGGDGNDGVVYVCRGRGGSEELPMELIISTLTYETGGGEQEAGEEVAVVGCCGCEQQAN